MALEYEPPVVEMREFKIFKNYLDLLAFACDSSLRDFSGELLPPELFEGLQRIKSDIQALQLEYSNCLHFTFKRLHYDNF